VTNAATFEHGSLHDKQGNKKKISILQNKKSSMQAGGVAQDRAPVLPRIKKKKKKEIQDSKRSK
jgi:hypothetical protein